MGDTPRQEPAVLHSDDFGLQHASVEAMLSAVDRPVSSRGEPMIVRQALSAAEVNEVLRAADHMADAYDVAYGKAHAALFMHRGGYFEQCCPELLSRLVAKMRGTALGWWTGSEEDEGELSLRCIEFHTYQAGGGLLDVNHRDTGSIVSMSILLADAAQMVGGRFVTWGADGPQTHELAQGDAIVFDSEMVHNVSTLTEGILHSLVARSDRGGEQ